MLYYAHGSENTVLSPEEIKNALFSVFDQLGNKQKVLVIPPDFSRFHSRAGELTVFTRDYYRDRLTDILPALGTHTPMTGAEIKKMFGNIPEKLFRIHNWRKDLKTLGTVPAEFVSSVSEGKVNYSWDAQVNKMLVEGNYDLILSIGQVVPHEVVGMANYNKNIFVGTGGPDGINKSHFLGAVYGMERMMGKADTPVRRVLNYASDNFARHLPLLYILTVIGRNETGNLVMRGLFIGDDHQCFNQASELSAKVNTQILPSPVEKVVVFLHPREFKSTWLGNKAVYRTRMALADGGELLILAPAVKEFGEDPEIDRLIRKYGYRTTAHILKMVNRNEDLQLNLSAAAHLIHGSSEGRFKITWCPGQLSGETIESVNYAWADVKTMMQRYNPLKLKEGFNTLPDGEKIFYISNPALGLWQAEKGRVKN